ncbi:MAG: glycine rich domain-containing protein [Bacteroides xylanisolvens]
MVNLVICGWCMAMSNIKTGDILNFDYTVQTVSLPKGTYKLECWGAQGGYSSSNSGIEVGMGGKGGYPLELLH